MTQDIQKTNDLHEVLTDATDGKINAVEAAKVKEALSKATPAAVEAFFHDEKCLPRNRENLLCIMEALGMRGKEHGDQQAQIAETMKHIAESTGVLVPADVSSELANGNKKDASNEQATKKAGASNEAGGGSGGDAPSNGIDLIGVGGSTPQVDEKVEKQGTPDSLDGMLSMLKNALPASLKEKWNVTPEQLRTQALSKLEATVRGKLALDKGLLKLSDEKRNAIVDAIVSNITLQMKTGARVDNIIMGGLFMATESLKKTQESFTGGSEKQTPGFNLNMARYMENVMNSSNDILSLASKQGGISDALTSKLGNVAETIQKLLPSKFALAFSGVGNLTDDLHKQEFSDGIAAIFAPGGELDFNTLPSTLATLEQATGTTLDHTTLTNKPGDITEHTKKNLEEVLRTIPTNALETAALKGDMMDKKFGKGIMAFILDLLKKSGILGLFPDLQDQLEGLALSKPRRELKIVTDAYMNAKKTSLEHNVKIDGATLGHVDAKTLAMMTTVNIDALSSTLKDANKFMHIESSVDSEALQKSFQEYLGKITDKDLWTKEQAFTTKVANVSTSHNYTYQDIFTSERATADNFVMYLKTGKLPHEYEDANAYLAGVIKEKPKAADEAKIVEATVNAPATASNTPPASLDATQKSPDIVLPSHIKKLEGKANSYEYTVQKGGSPEAIKKIMSLTLNISADKITVMNPDKKTTFSSGAKVEIVATT